MCVALVWTSCVCGAAAEPTPLYAPSYYESPLPPAVDTHCLPRNFGAVDPPGTVVLPVGYYGPPPNYLVRPWYMTPYRNYSYYRPWYTYGSYGPTYYRYHYAPSWGYRPLPYYAPPYLSPGAYAPPDGPLHEH
jgi:hypothetical protein